MSQNDTNYSPNLPEYSVSEIAAALKRTVEDNFGYVRIRGEISGFIAARSGHMYFSLKDDKAVIDSVIWRQMTTKLRFNPEDGLEVICSGKLSTYAPRSRYQLVVDSIEPAGIGALMALLEERRNKLSLEGLFAQERKKPLPYLPQVIGVVTSPTGAVIRDILHRLRDRFPSRVLLWPVLVQGKGAAEQVAMAIQGFNSLDNNSLVPRPDLLIVARGGGSIEDLWVFNEEIVARAAANSLIPLISAIGHETDTTLIDFISDQRAPTPTAAAEMAVPVRTDLVFDNQDYGRRLALAAQRILSERKRDLGGLARGLHGPREVLALTQQRFDETADRLKRALLVFGGEKRNALVSVSGRFRPNLVSEKIAVSNSTIGEYKGRLIRVMETIINELRLKLKGQVLLLDSLSFERVLERGYAMIRQKDGKLVVSANQAKPGKGLAVLFHDGERLVTVTDQPSKKPSNEINRPSSNKLKKHSPKTENQGSLF